VILGIIIKIGTTKFLLSLYQTY